jgi:hypothetical protein
MFLEYAFAAKHLCAEAVAAPVAGRLTAGTGLFLAQEPLASDEDAQVLVAIFFDPMSKIVVLA